ncbi:MAG: PAS domain S-box protein, partial [Anaerolineales bacterium]
MKADRKTTKPIGRGKSKTQEAPPTPKAVKPKPYEKKTDSKRAEKDLRESEERFRALIENASDLIVTITADGNLNYVSPAAERITGYKANEAIGRNIVEFIHADDLPLALQALTSRTQTPGLSPAPIELRFRHKDGMWRMVEILGNNLLEYPAVKGIVLNVRDITERKQAEEELTIANEELVFQNEEKEKRATELILANKELAFQNEEKEKRAAELVIANKESERRLKHTQALRAIDVAITASTDLQFTLKTALDQAVTELGVDAASVLLLNPSTHTLKYAAGRGFRSNAYRRTQVRLGGGLAGKAALEREIFAYPDFTVNQPNFTIPKLMADESFAAYYAVPLIAKGFVNGVLEIFHRAPLHPDDEWLTFLETIAGQVAIAVDSATMFNDLHRSNIDLMTAYDTT